MTDINTELTISLFSAYGAFVPADQLGVSGVLAVVACGVYLGFRAPEIASPESRMQAYGAVVDAHVPAQRDAVHPHRAAAAGRSSTGSAACPAGEVIGYAAAVCAAVIAVRFLWNFIDHRPHPGDRSPALAARAPRRAGAPRVVGELGGDARRGLAGGGAGAAADDRRRRPAARPRADPVHHLRADPRHGGRAGAHAAVADPPPRRRRGRHRGGARGAARAAGDRPRRARPRRRARGRGLDARRHRRARPPALRVPPAALQDPGGQDRGRGRARGGLARLPADDARDLRGPARSALVELRNSREISSDVMRRVEHELDLEESRLEV